LVLLAKRKLAWGDAVMRVRVNRAETLTKVADQLSRSMAQLNQGKQAALSRRMSFVNALIGAIP
jgi:cell division protein ZapA (FtsZ GTPase activity inhibitor)